METFCLLATCKGPDLDLLSQEISQEQQRFVSPFTDVETLSVRFDMKALLIEVAKFVLFKI